MTPPFDTTLPQPPGDPGSGWLLHTRCLRQRLASLHRQAAGTPLAPEANQVVIDVNRLCDYVELLHREADKWLAAKPRTRMEPQSSSGAADPPEIQSAAVDVQREQHEPSDSVSQFLKALLMWVDTPEERARESVEVTPRP